MRDGLGLGVTAGENDFDVHDAPARDVMTPRTAGLAANSPVPGELSVEDRKRGGEV